MKGPQAVGRVAETEDALKRGTLRGIVATHSLEMGLDMGAVGRYDAPIPAG